MINSKGKIGRHGISFLRELKDAADQHPELVSEWGQQFLSSIMERVDFYGEDTYLSEKQANHVEIIATNLGLV